MNPYDSLWLFMTLCAQEDNTLNLNPLIYIYISSNPSDSLELAYPVGGPNAWSATPGHTSDRHWAWYLGGAPGKHGTERVITRLQKLSHIYTIAGFILKCRQWAELVDNWHQKFTIVNTSLTGKPPWSKRQQPTCGHTLQHSIQLSPCRQHWAWLLRGVRIRQTNHGN